MNRTQQQQGSSGEYYLSYFKSAQTPSCSRPLCPQWAASAPAEFSREGSVHLQGDVGAAWLFSGLTTSPHCWERSPETCCANTRLYVRAAASRIACGPASSEQCWRGRGPGAALPQLSHMREGGQTLQAWGKDGGEAMGTCRASAAAFPALLSGMGMQSKGEPALPQQLVDKPLGGTHSPDLGCRAGAASQRGTACAPQTVSLHQNAGSRSQSSTASGSAQSVLRREEEEPQASPCPMSP